MQDLTSAQILFLWLAGMEDAQIKAGNGLVKRVAVGGQKAMTTADYFAAKRTRQPGTAEHAQMIELRNKQSGLRKILDGKVRKLAQADMRYR